MGVCKTLMTVMRVTVLWPKKRTGEAGTMKMVGGYGKRVFS
jgi:hypothetical protein